MHPRSYLLFNRSRRVDLRTIDGHRIYSAVTSQSVVRRYLDLVLELLVLKELHWRFVVFGDYTIFVYDIHDRNCI